MKKILSLVDNKLVLSYRQSANQKPHSFIQSIFIEYILWAGCRSWVCCDGMKQFVVAVHSFSHIWLFVTPWTVVHQALLSFTTSWSLLKLTSIELVDAIQPSHPLSSPSPPAFNLSQKQGLFQWVGSSHQVAKVLELQLQHQSFQWIVRVDFL